MKNLRAIILAAGMGTRMKSDVPKVLHTVCGRPIIQYILDLTTVIGSLKTFLVLGHKSAEIQKHLSSQVNVVEQKNMLGTADAVRCAESHFKGYSGDVLILCGDTPLLRKETLKVVVQKHRKSNVSATVLTAVVHNPKGYGRIVRDENGDVIAIREDKDAVGYEKNLSEINVGVYCFKSAELFKALKAVTINAKKKEFYLTDIIELLFRDGQKIASVETEDFEEGLGINTREDLAVAQKVLGKRILRDFMLQGVTISDPETTYINANVKIGRDTTIHPFTFIEGDVKIGARCQIGPFARLRSGTRIDDNVEIGNFTEITRTKVGRNTFMKHFSYLGDANIGVGVNIGAGTVTANFDGKNKNITRVDDGAFIGSDSILIAPVKVGKKAILGAGSVVTKGKIIPDNCVAVGVPARIINNRGISKGKSV